MSTLLTLRELFTDYVKIDPNNRIFSNTQKDKMLNRAYFQIQKDGMHRWRECVQLSTESSVAGTSLYTLPTDFIKLSEILYNNFPLRKTEREKVLIYGASSGIPNSYYIYSNTIGLYPTPVGTDSMTMVYYKRLPTLTTSQDSLLPSDFDDAIALYAAYIALKSINKTDLAALCLSDYSGVLSTLLTSYIFDDTNIGFSYQRTSTRFSDTNSGNLFRN